MQHLDFYIQGNIDYHEELTTGKDVTKGCKMIIALVNNEEWYTSEKRVRFWYCYNRKMGFGKFQSYTCI